MAERDLIGETLLGRYRVTRAIGKGGMGAVYEAIHVGLGKRVAIKVLLDRYADHPELVQRLEQEARLASAIGDAHIVDVADIGRTDDGRPFIVMELLDGESLAQLLERTTPPESRLARLVAQAARALAAAHGKGVIHRDIKPENLFVLERGGEDFVKVVDFGISKLVGGGTADRKLTGTGMVIGTTAYMSPEQARGEDVDERCDVYALGVVIYEAATGELPFTGDNDLQVLGRIANVDPPPPRALRPAISPELERICMTAMAKRREDRYATATALADALDALRAGSATAATAPAHVSAHVSAPRPRRRATRWIAGAVAAVVALAAVGVVLARRGSSDADRVEVSIQTDPPGAAILQGDKVLGYTPMTYRFLRENKVVELTAQMIGFDIACFVINPLEEAHEVHVRMPKAGTTDCLHRR
jgi:eukaryotic-like serine/threonine-protein kinase